MPRVVSPPREVLAQLRQPLTEGERLVFEFFDAHLAHEWEIYITPHLNGLRPDFVLLNPNAGIAVFEVKDWDLDAMHYEVRSRGKLKSPELIGKKDGKTFSLQRQNPIDKVFRYKQEIFNLYCPRLQERAGFAVITAGVIFPFADDQRVKNLLKPSRDYRYTEKYHHFNPLSGRLALQSGDIEAVFPESVRVYSDRINESLAQDLRKWLIEPDFAAAQRTPIELDSNQRSFVTTRTESGYRRIRGAAGSGKSLVLAARASQLIGEGKRVLVVTFNITLLHYLMDVSVRWPTERGNSRHDITWVNFHAWCKHICCEYDCESEYNELWKKLEGGDTDNILNVKLPKLVDAILTSAEGVEQYDAILVDEAQDFHLSWWSLLRKVCKPGGEMLLVADLTQDIYGTASAWTDEAMKGAGFTGKWAELGLSYRLPDLVATQASAFAQQYLPDATRIIPIPVQASLGIEPCHLRWVYAPESSAAKICHDEIMLLFSSDKYEGYSIADATFLCDNGSIGYEVVRLLGNKGIKCVHTYDPDKQVSRRQKVGFYMGDSRIKATTLHSFKGWEARSLVIYLGDVVSPSALALLYTGMTRLKKHIDGSCITVICGSQELCDYGRTWPDFFAYNESVAEC